MRLRYALFALVLAAAPAAAQDPADLPFTVDLVELTRPEVPALHSFAWAEHDGLWLFVAGRTDGLHGFGEDPFPNPFASDEIWVVDPATGDAWSASLSGLPDALADPLRATNTQFHQEGETLYVVGGYGHSTAADGKITFPTLTVIDVPGMIEAVRTGGAIAPHLRQLEDERLAVTGGELRAFYEDYLLFGGHRFDGEYSGPGSDFTQVYTKRVFAFHINDGGGTLSIGEHYSLEDPVQLRRRDLTAAPTYIRQGTMSGGTELVPAYGLYGGVFQPSIDLPLRNPVYFAYSDVPYHDFIPFEQRFAHYTCPALPLFDAETETMHTTFFGGMAQFYMDEETGVVREDPLVPFTDDIVTLTAELAEGAGAIFETVMPVQMPGLLGTNAAFIPADGVPRTAHGVVKLRALTGRTLVGHIVGGLESTAPNAGRLLIPDGTSATNRIFAVYVTPTFETAVEPAAPAGFALDGPFPNPFHAEATVAVALDAPTALGVAVYDGLGRRVALLHDGLLGAGRHTFSLAGAALPAGVYFVRITGDGFSETRPVVRVR